MKASTRVFSLLAQAVSAVVFLAPGAALAQNYPTKSVVFVVPFEPGGSTELIARIMAQGLGKMWGQSVVVDFRPGAGSMIGTEAVVKAAPDGYTLLDAPINLATNMALYEKTLTYDALRDLAPVMLIYTSPQALVVNAGSSAKSVKELVALAKVKGKMNFGSSSMGGINHLTGELFSMMSQVSSVHIPYKGGAAALTDLMGGRLDFMFNGTTGTIPLIQSGKLRALAVTSPTRVASLPDVPTLSESGLTGFESSIWNAIFAPAKTPAAIINKINADANKVLGSPEMQKTLNTSGSEPQGGSPQQLGTFLKEETVRWTKVVKTANIEPE